MLLRLRQPLDLPGVPQPAAAGGRAGRADPVAADPRRRRVQRGQPERLRGARAPGAGQARLHAQGPAGLGARGRRDDPDAAERVPGQQRQGDARLLLARAAGAARALRGRGVRGLLGPRPGHRAGRGARRHLRPLRHRCAGLLRGDRRAGWPQAERPPARTRRPHGPAGCTGPPGADRPLHCPARAAAARPCSNDRETP